MQENIIARYGLPQERTLASQRQFLAPSSVSGSPPLLSRGLQIKHLISGFQRRTMILLTQSVQESITEQKKPELEH